MSQFQKLAWVAAVVFVLLGVLGFIPGIADDEQMLFGMFHVDTTHNVVHLLTGLVAGIAAMTSTAYSRLFFQGFGVIYGLVTIVGFVQGDTFLGLFVVNAADNWLHLVFAVVLLGVGFGVKESNSSSGVQM